MSMNILVKDERSRSWVSRYVDINGFSSIGSAVLIAGFVPITLMVAPALVGGLITGYGFTGQQAGYIIAAELAGMGLATLPGLIWANHPVWRKMAWLSLIVMIIVYLISVFNIRPEILLYLRFVSGLAGGTIMSVILATISQSKAADRNFGLWLASQLVIGAIGLALAPLVLPTWGLEGYFLVMAIICFALLVPASFLPVGSENLIRPKAESAFVSSISQQRYVYLATIGMLSILFFCIGLNGTWAYMERIGNAAGINPLTIAGTLSTASIFGIVGAIAATILGNRIGRLPVILFGVGLLIFALFLMRGQPSVLNYTIAAFIFKYSWTFTFPYLLAVMAGIDQTGKLLIISNIVIGGGMALGPAISAQLIGDTGLHYGRIIVMAISVMMMCSILIIPLVTHAKKQDQDIDEL